MGKNGVAMLELEDMQHFLLTRPQAMAARYGFLCFRRPEHGRAWLAGGRQKACAARPREINRDVKLTGTGTVFIVA